MKRCGFTLMEVLVTLGIIGIVSALTVPVLVQNWQKKTYVTQLHKVYNVFSQSFEKAMAEKRAMSLYEADIVPSFRGADSGNQNGIKNFLHEHFKVVKDCGNNYSQCFAPSYKSLEGGTRNTTIGGYCISIADGTSVCMQMDDEPNGNETVGSIIVDTNGSKGPNIAGRDFFRMYIYGDGIIDDYDIDPTCRKNTDCARQRRQDNFESYCMNPNDTDGCFGRILNDDWEMKY